MVVGTAYGQSQKEKYAATLYENMAYLEASKVYSEIADKQIKKESVEFTVMLKAGETNYYSRQYSSAAKYYGIANNIAMLKGSDLNKYIDALIRIKNYDALKMVSSKNTELDDNAGVGLEFIEELHSGLNANKDNYSITEYEHNSGEGEYGAIAFNGSVYFSSSRKGLGFTHEEYEWDGVNYTNVFCVDSTNSLLLVKEARSNLHDGPISFSPDNNTAYLTRTEFIKKGKKEIKHVKLYVSSISDGVFSAWNGFKYNSSEYNLGHATISSDGLILYFASDMNGGYGGSDLYKSELLNGEWGEPVNLGPKINTAGDEMFPFVSTDDNLYFSSNRNYGLGGLDVYVFNNNQVENLGAGVNSSMDDFAFNLDKDNKFGYLSSDRDSNIDKIYNVTVNTIFGRLLISPMDIIKGIPISDVDVYLTESGSISVLKKLSLNDDGLYEIAIENNKDYVIGGNKKDYELDGKIYLNTNNLASGEVIEKDLNFNQTHYDILVKTVVKGTGEICPLVTGIFNDPMTGEKIAYTTDENGEALINIENNHTYDVTATKKGYLNLKELVHTDASVLIELDLQMQEIKKDVKFEIKNILYDLAKWDLRPESTVELDKLVVFLTVNDNIKVELSAHTDSRASSSYNQRLSQKRAQSCVDYLITKGVAKERIVAKGYGESQLLNKCKDGVECSEEEHQRNRRTEIKILSVSK